MSRPTIHIEDQYGATDAGRNRNTHPLGWYERLQDRAARITGQTSGAVYTAKFNQLLEGHRKYLTISAP